MEVGLIVIQVVSGGVASLEDFSIVLFFSFDASDADSEGFEEKGFAVILPVLEETA